MSSIRRRAFLRTLNFHTAKAPMTTSIRPRASDRAITMASLLSDDPESTLRPSVLDEANRRFADQDKVMGVSGGRRTLLLMFCSVL